MSKRYAPARLNLSTKKPKLDILINSQSNRNYDNVTTSQGKYEPKTDPGPSSRHQEDVWGDDLDVDAVEECMFVASQLTQQVPDQNVSELPTFTEFKPPQMSSTQMSQQRLNNQNRFNLKSTTSNVKHNDIADISNHFPVPSTFIMPSSSAQLNKSLNSPKPCSYVVKTNAPIYCEPKTSSIKLNTHNISNFNRSTCSIMNGNSFVNNAEELKDRLHNVNGNQQLQKELENLRLENERLKTENGKAMDRFLTKEGEVTILRSQLATSKAAAESLRMERLQWNEKSRMEQDQQLALAKKQVNDLMAQLKFKDLEIMNVNDRCRLLESKKIRLTEPQSQRLSDVSQLPMPNNLNSPKNRSARMERKSTSTVSIQTITNFKVQINEDNFIELPLLEAFPKELYEECERENDKFENTKLAGNKHSDQDCMNTRSLLPDMYLLSKLSKKQLKAQNISSCLNKIISITKALAYKVLKSLKNPSENLQKQLCKKICCKLKDQSNSIYQAKPWHNEIFIELRRCLAITAVLIKYCPYLKQFLTETHFDKLIKYDSDVWFQEHWNCLELHNNENNSILLILLGILDRLPHDNLCFIHESLLISITEFMISSFMVSSIDELPKLMKALVFIKPPSKVIQRITVLLEFLSVNNTYLEMLCVKSSDKLALNFEKGVYVYTADSCFLQVLAGSLETCIPRSYIEQDEYCSLHDLSHKVTNFVHNAMTNELAWTYPQTECLCLSSIMTSIVVLLHYCVEQYRYKISKFIENLMYMSSLSKVLQSGILTLHQILIRDPEQANNLSLQLGYFGGRFLSIINFACDMKERLFEDSLHREFMEQVLKDMLFYHPNPEENFKRETEFCEGTYHNLFKFTL